MTHEEGAPSWRFIGFYRDPKTEDHQLSWNLSQRLANMDISPWLLGGDFNAILREDEKEGGSTKSARDIIGFQEPFELRGVKISWVERASVHMV